MGKIRTMDAGRKIALDMMGGCALALLGFSSLSASLPALAAQQAGVAAGVIGVLRVSEGERPQAEQVKSGMDMLLGDRVNSEKASRMQVLLLDETVFTIGPDSDLVIDEFVYDPGTQTGRLTANFTKGVLRYVSGKVALSSPTAVTIKARDATIGVRGTALFAMDDPESPDGSQFIGLLGPGGRNDGGLKVGGMTVSTPQGSTDIFRAGFGTFVSPGKAPGPAVLTPPRLTLLLQTQLTAPVAASEAPAGGEGESDSGGGATESGTSESTASDVSGESTAATGLDSQQVAGVLSELGVVANTVVQAEEAGIESETQSPPPPPVSPPPPPPAVA
ncbi:MAG: FecR domain-containing protein, partial [Alphaproteobacteria bacterium]